MALTHESQLTSPDCPIAFKEWAGVCSALETGRQSILLRKGGIQDESGVFRPGHSRFWLYPTNVHEAQQGLHKFVLQEQACRPGFVRIGLLVEIESRFWIDRLDTALELSELHVWTEETIRKRFSYRSPGLWAFSVRAYYLAEPVLIRELPEYLGCKTWVNLEQPIPIRGLLPVLDEREANLRRESLDRLLAEASTED